MNLLISKSDVKIVNLMPQKYFTHQKFKNINQFEYFFQQIVEYREK